MKPMVLGFGFWLFYRKLGDQGEMFSIFGYKEKDFKPLMRTFWVSKWEHMKSWVVFLEMGVFVKAN